MVWGAAPSPFGTAVLVVTDYGLAGIGFADGETTIEAAFEDLRDRWPNARYHPRRCARSRRSRRASSIRRAGTPDQPVKSC